MIQIVNVGPFNDPNPLGERTYEVRINNKVITTFKHKRIDGLSKCLFEASRAVEKNSWEIWFKEAQENFNQSHDKP